MLDYDEMRLDLLQRCSTVPGGRTGGSGVYELISSHARKKLSELFKEGK